MFKKAQFFAAKSFALLFLGSLLFSCSPETNITPSSSVSNINLPIEIQLPKVQKGMLFFQSFDHYKQYAQFVQTHSIEQLSTFHQSLGFTSRYDANVQERKDSLQVFKAALATMAKQNPSIDITALDNFALSGVDELVTDDYFSSLLDKNREMRIGKQTYRLIKGYCFLYEEEAASAVATYQSRLLNKTYSFEGEKIEISPALTIYKTMQRKTPVATAANYDKNTAKVTDNREAAINVGSSDRHMNCEIWMENLQVYASSGARTYYTEWRETCVWFACWKDWRSTNARSIAVSGNLLISVGNDPTQSWEPVNASGSNISEAKHRINWYAGKPIGANAVTWIHAGTTQHSTTSPQGSSASHSLVW